MYFIIYTGREVNIYSLLMNKQTYIDMEINVNVISRVLNQKLRDDCITEVYNIPVYRRKL